MNIEIHSRRDSSGIATVNHNLGSKIMSSDSDTIQEKRISILTRKLNTVQIPSI